MTKIFIATPAYDGKVHVQYAISLAETSYLLRINGIEIMPRIHVSGSLICAERNRLIESFMKSDCTHILMIDSDLGWPAEAVLKMLEKDMDFIVGCYPARQEKTFLFRPDLAENESIIVNEEKQLLKMLYVPAGFMLIKRDVIQKIREFFPDRYFKPKMPEDAPSGYCLFSTEVNNGEFWGEDYVFCGRAREAGFEIWADPMIEFDHAGNVGMLMNVLTQDKEKAMKL